MAVSYGFTPALIYKAFTNNNDPLSGGKLYTFLAGTTTPENTFKDISGSHNDNPVILDARGEAVVLLDTAKAYKFVLTDANGVPVGDPVDNITSSGGSGGSGSATDQLVKVSAVDEVAGYLNTKLIAGTNCTLTLVNGALGDSLQIDIDVPAMVIETIADSSTIDLTLTGTELKADLVLSGAVGQRASVVADGLLVTETINSIADSSTIDLTLTGTELKAEVVISSLVGNKVVDAGGIYVGVDFISQYDNTATINLNVDGAGTLTADVVIAPFAENILTEESSGLLAMIHNDVHAKADCGLSGFGTEASPLGVYLDGSTAKSNTGVVQWSGAGALGSATISSGSGEINIVNLDTSLSKIAFTSISCPVASTIGTYNFAQVYVDNAGVVHHQNGGLTQIQKDARCVQLFVYTSVTGTTTTGVNLNTKWSGQNPETLMRDLFDLVGNPKNGLSLKAGTANAQLGIGAGTFIAMGSNNTSGQNKMARAVAGTSFATFYMATQSTLELTALTELNNVYFNPSGSTKTLVANNKWTNLRVFAVYDSTAPNQMTIIVQWGQAEYNSKDLAVGGIETESFVTNPNTNSMFYLGFVTMEKGGLSANAKFTSTTKWQDGSSSGGSGSFALVGVNQGVVKNVAGVASVSPDHYVVSTEAELMQALSADGALTGWRTIHCAHRINITTNNTAITTNEFAVVQFSGCPIYFSGSGKINLTCPAVVILCHNEVYFDVNITNPFGTASAGNHNVKYTQLKGTSVCAVTHTPSIGCLYEKVTVCTTNASQSYWYNTFVVAGNPTSPIALNWVTFGKSACSNSFTSSSPCGSIIDPTIDGVVTQMSLLISSAGAGLITLYVFDMTSVVQTGGSAPVLAKITFNVSRSGEVFIDLTGGTSLNNGVSSVTITKSTGFNWDLLKSKVYGVSLQDNGATNWLGNATPNTGFPTAPTILNGSVLNTSAVVSSAINAPYVRMRN